MNLAINIPGSHCYGLRVLDLKEIGAGILGVYGWQMSRRMVRQAYVAGR